MGRPILQKQVGYTLFRPAAYSLGGLVADMPFGAFQIILFSMIVYLSCGLPRSGGAFFTFYLPHRVDDVLCNDDVLPIDWHYYLELQCCRTVGSIYYHYHDCL